MSTAQFPLLCMTGLSPSNPLNLGSREHTIITTDSTHKSNLVTVSDVSCI